MPVLLPRTMSTRYEGLEYSVHSATVSVHAHVKPVFPEGPLENATLLVVPTCQKSGVSLAAYGEVEQVEKDRLLERFLMWSKEVCSVLWAQGHWADVSDPASGGAYFGRASSAIWSDVEGLAQLLRFQKCESATGVCGMVRHPEWGLEMYPATMFTTAPEAAVRDALSRKG